MSYSPERRYVQLLHLFYCVLLKDIVIRITGKYQNTSSTVFLVTFSFISRKNLSISPQPIANMALVGAQYYKILAARVFFCIIFSHITGEIPFLSIVVIIIQFASQLDIVDSGVNKTKWHYDRQADAALQFSYIDCK